MLRAQVLLWSLSTGLDLTTRQTTNNHRQTSWDTFAFLGCFLIHTGRTPPLTPQTMLDASIQNFFWVSILYRVGGGRTARKFRKWRTVLRGNREMREKYAYCSTVPRTFVHDWRFWAHIFLALQLKARFIGLFLVPKKRWCTTPLEFPPDQTSQHETHHRD